MLQMTPSRKKWALRIGSLALIGGGALFLLRVTERAESTAPPARPAAVQDNPVHELKELAVQLQKKPGHLPVLMRMAQIEHDQGKLAEAEAHLREALAGEPGNADVHLELGLVLYEKGDKTRPSRKPSGLWPSTRNTPMLYTIWVPSTPISATPDVPVRTGRS